MNNQIKENIIELLVDDGCSFILEENNEHDILLCFENVQAEKGLFIQKKIANLFVHELHAVGMDDSNSHIRLFVEFNSIRKIRTKTSIKNRSIKTTPKRIQPFYKAWMKVSPNEPRAWEIEWENNLHYSNWINRMQIRYKNEVINKYMDYAFWVGLPYSISEDDKFINWLFSEVKINCNSVII